MAFIELTLFNGKPIYIAVNNITDFYRKSDLVTLLETTGYIDNSAEVKETPEEIMKLIEEMENSIYYTPSLEVVSSGEISGVVLKSDYQQGREDAIKEFAERIKSRKAYFVNYYATDTAAIAEADVYLEIVEKMRKE